MGYGSSFADDELADARATSALFSSRHREVLLNRETFEDSLHKIVSCLEEPIAASSIVPMYFVCQRAREDVKVALVGQGPDELFGGYRRHLGVRYGGMWGALPGWVRSPLAAVIRELPRSETLKRGLHSLDVKERMQRYQHVLSLMPGEGIDALFQEGALDAGAGDEILNCWQDLRPLMSETDELGGLQFLEMRSTLPDELLMYGDKLSMAHSLEVRVPYLDKEIVEYVERLPAAFKVRNGSRKWLHRQVCQRFLPSAIMKRKKRGFAVNVVDDWFRANVNSRMDEIFMDGSSAIYKYLKPAAVQEMYRRHKSGRNDFHKVLFSVVVFEQWLRVQSAQDAVHALEPSSTR